MPRDVEHLADLLVAALREPDFVPDVVAIGTIELTDLGRRQLSPIDRDAAPQSVDLVVARMALHLCVVGLLDEPGPRHRIGQGAVVRKDQQALGVEIEPADRVDLLPDVRGEQVDRERTIQRILRRRQVAARLVEQHVDLLAIAKQRIDRSSVDANVVDVGVRLRTKLGHDDTVHRHRAGFDHLFGLSTRRDAGFGDQFLESFEHVLFCNPQAETTAPPQLDPAPAVHPKQCGPVTMRRLANAAGSKSWIVGPTAESTSRSSIWLKSQS